MTNDMESWWWEEVEAFIRRHGTLKIAYHVIVYLTTLVSLLGTWFGWLGISASAYLLLAATVVAMAVITYVVAGVAGMRAKKFRRLLDIFRELVALQRHSYYIEKVEHRRVIQPNGDAGCTREAQICSRGAPIFWEEISFGATPEANGVYRFEDLKFTVTGTDTRIPMKNVVISDDEHRKQVVVMFNPPATPGRPARFTINYRWPKAWKQLLTEGFDYGVITVVCRTKQLTLELKVPDGYFIEHFHVNPEVGAVEICDTKSTATWKAENLSRGEYRYEVHCSQLPTKGGATE